MNMSNPEILDPAKSPANACYIARPKNMHHDGFRFFKLLYIFYISVQIASPVDLPPLNPNWFGDSTLVLIIFSNTFAKLVINEIGL